MTKRQIAALLKSRKSVRIDIGCGDRKSGEDWIGIDRRTFPGVDIVHDLWKFPWPLPDACARVVAMSHYWEHVPPYLTLDTMAEIHRILQPGGHLYVAGPYGMGMRYQQDPTHCNPSLAQTWYYWDPRAEALYNVYRPPPLHVLSYVRIPAPLDSDFNAVLQKCVGKDCPLCPKPLRVGV